MKNNKVILFEPKREGVTPDLNYPLSSLALAASLLENNFDKICWKTLSSNSHPRAIELLLEHPKNIDYEFLSSNTHSTAIRLLEHNIEKVNWFHLSSNRSALLMGLLEKHKATGSRPTPP